MENGGNLEQHLYLKILKYAFENDVFTEKEMCEAIGFSNKQFIKYVQRGKIAEDITNIEGTKNAQKWRISYDAFLNYLEYIELNEARGSSKSAKKLALLAIGISAVLALSSIVISLIQLFNPTTVKINDSQLNKIVMREETTRKRVPANLKE